MSDSITGIAGMTALGATGSGATYWLTQINPWMAFFSGVLTIAFMAWSLCRMWNTRKQPKSRWK